MQGRSATGAGAGGEPHGGWEGGRGQRQRDFAQWLLHHPARAHSLPEGELPGERAPNPCAKPRGRLSWRGTPGGRGQRPHGSQGIGTPRGPSPALGLQQALQVHEVHQQPLNVFASGTGGVQGAVVSGRRPARCANCAESPPPRPSPLAAGRQSPRLALLQLVVHPGCLVVQPLEVPIGPLKGHFRLDAEGDGGR